MVKVLNFQHFSLSVLKKKMLVIKAGNHKRLVRIANRFGSAMLVKASAVGNYSLKI